MNKKYKHTVFIFRRDLRLFDNTALIKALKSSEIVYPIFILTPEQVVNNPLKSNNAVQFMIESLFNLDEQLQKKQSRLQLFYGSIVKVLKDIIKEYDIESVYINADYTPFSKNRDKAIASLCKEMAIDFCSYDDVCLHPMKTIVNKQNRCYLKFTPFFNQAKKRTVSKPVRNRYDHYYQGKLKNTISHKAAEAFFSCNYAIEVNGGRSNGLSILRSIKKFKNYNHTKNIPGIATTRLSAHNKFGTVSIREVYYKFAHVLGLGSDLIRQLYWREFYYNIFDHFPFLLHRSLKEQYDAISWDENESYLQAWKDGLTGFPLVDAGMRQMNKTGFMHNRVRLVAGSLLCKILLINWRSGEQYFAKTLVDYDPAQNNGNWAWISGSGVDSQPYFRVFNPFLQSQKFDPDCAYIKTWIPSLRKVLPRHIHKWDIYAKQYDLDYPAPLVNYLDQKKKGQSKYQQVLSSV